MLLPESFTGAEGKAAAATRNIWLVELNLLPNRSSAQRVLMRPRRKRATQEQNYLVQVGSSSVTCSGSTSSNAIRFSGNHIQVSRNVVLEAHDIWRRGSGDMPKDRFWSHDKHDSWRRLRALDVAKWTSRSPKVCAHAQVWLLVMLYDSPRR